MDLVRKSIFTLFFPKIMIIPQGNFFTKRHTCKYMIGTFHKIVLIPYLKNISKTMLPAAINIPLHRTGIQLYFTEKNIMLPHIMPKHTTESIIFIPITPCIQPSCAGPRTT